MQALNAVNETSNLAQNTIQHSSFGKHVKGIHNELSDSLSCQQFDRFLCLSKKKGMDQWPEKLSD